jgi:hypothetical protein
MVSLEGELSRIQARRLWEARLQESDSVFARLVFVSQLRDASGRYADPFLRRLFPSRTCHQLVSDAHREVFREWLTLSARMKVRDLKRYCNTICASETSDKTAWTCLCAELVPSGISINELRLFSEDVKRLTHMVHRQPKSRNGRRRRL